MWSNYQSVARLGLKQRPPVYETIVLTTTLRRAEGFFLYLIEGTVTAKVLSSRNRREGKQDRKSQPFRERILSVQDKIHPGKSNPWPSVYKSEELQNKLIRPAVFEMDCINQHTNEI
jgi:hypothetical protein